MVLYTKKALIDSTLDTPVDTIEQMETSIITAYEGANNAMEDSGLGLTLNVVHMAYVSTSLDEVDDVHVCSCSYGYPHLHQKRVAEFRPPQPASRRAAQSIPDFIVARMTQIRNIFAWHLPLVMFTPTSLYRRSGHFYRQVKLVALHVHLWR